MKRKNRGGGSNSNFIRNHMGGFMSIIFGCIAIFIAIIMFQIGLAQIDTAYTAAATYTEAVGYDETVGVVPLILFLVFMMVGLGAVAGGAVMQAVKAIRGGWTEVFMGVIFGTVSFVIALIMNGIIATQLHAAYVAANATTNIANFSGLLSVMGVFYLVIFWVIIGAGISSIAASGYGAYKNIRGQV